MMAESSREKAALPTDTPLDPFITITLQEKERWRHWQKKREMVLYGQNWDRSAGVHHRGRLGDNWTVGGRIHSIGETVWTGNTGGQMDGEEN